MPLTEQIEGMLSDWSLVPLVEALQALRGVDSIARRMLIEAAWSYRFPARISRDQWLRQERLPKPIRDIAWKAQQRLCGRNRRLARAGKPNTVVTAAIARELAGFVWAIALKVPTPGR